MNTLTLKRENVGQISLADGLVDITDPGYDKDVWCRTDDLPVKKGKYNCYAYICVNGDSIDNGRCFICSIVHEEYNINDIPKTGWKELCAIGVDAGMAGFFSHKPDFNDDVWSILCDQMLDKQFAVMHELCEGFFTSSGYGDGSYNVFAHYDDNEIIALEIRF